MFSIEDDKSDIGEIWPMLFFLEKSNIILKRYLRQNLSTCEFKKPIEIEVQKINIVFVN